MSSTTPAAKRPRSKLDRQVDAVMDASRVMVAVVAQSVAEAEVSVSLPGLRVLMMVNQSDRPLKLGTVAEGLGVHPSNATRTCSRLVDAGLLDRRDDPADRRSLALTLTPKGQSFVDSVLERRRQAFERMLSKMSATDRDRLADTLREFAKVSGGTPHEIAEAFGWLR